MSDCPEIVSAILDEVKNNTKLSDTELASSLEKNKEEIIRILTFDLYPDLVDAKIKKIKNRILSLYTKEISKLISKQEIYNHDLDPRLVAGIAELLESIVYAEVETNFKYKMKYYNYCLKLCCFLKHISQYLLIILYKKRIDEYRITLKNFNCSGVHVNNIPFDIHIKKSCKDFQNEYTKGLNVYKRYFTKKGIINKKVIIGLKRAQEDIGFDSVILKAEKIIKDYEMYYPHIINNGYNRSFAARAFEFVMNVISLGFLIYSIIKIISWLS